MCSCEAIIGIVEDIMGQTVGNKKSIFAGLCQIKKRKIIKINECEYFMENIGGWREADGFCGERPLGLGIIVAKGGRFSV